MGRGATSEPWRIGRSCASLQRCCESELAPSLPRQSEPPGERLLVPILSPPAPASPDRLDSLHLCLLPEVQSHASSPETLLHVFQFCSFQTLTQSLKPCHSSRIHESRTAGHKLNHQEQSLQGCVRDSVPSLLLLPEPVRAAAVGQWRPVVSRRLTWGPRVFRRSPDGCSDLHHPCHDAGAEGEQAVGP